MPRSWRLTRSSEFKSIMRGGSRSKAGRLSVFWTDNELGHPRVGLVVPKYGYTSVARNRLQRLLREAVRRDVLRELGSIDLVIRATEAAYQYDYRGLVGDLREWSSSLGR